MAALNGSRETTLGKCADWLSGGTPRKSRDDFWGGDFPWASAKDMKVFRLYDTEDHITQLAIDEGARVAPEGAILILVRGMTLHNDVPLCVTMREMAFNQDVRAIVPKEGTDLNYLAYWLLAKKPMLLGLVDSAGHGTGRFHTDVLKALEISLPPLPEQRAIASILGALDDKIELNRRMNATLESLARAIFKSWFVDFDPVHANAIRQNAGKTGAGQMPASSAIPTTHDPKVFDLFPSTFQDSELGPIPEGWGPIKLESILELAYGKALKKSDRIAGRYPVYGSGGLTGSHNESLVDGPGVIVGRKGSVGTLYWEDSAFYPIDTVFYVKPHDGYSLQYIFYLLQTLGLDDMNTDAAVPGLNRNNAYRLEIPSASQDAMDEFTTVAVAIREQIAGNIADTDALATIRDEILPQLLSGELPVPESLTANEEVLA